MTPSATGAAVGLVLGCGFVLVASWLLARRPLRMVDRIGPFVGLRGPASAARRERTITLRSLVRMWSVRSAPADADPGLVARLARAGVPTSVAHYRLERLTWAGIGGASGFALGLLLAASGPSPMVAGLIAGMGALAGWSACDARLRHRVRVRQSVIESQLPLLADLVALAVSAGATPVAALESAAVTIGGPMAQEVDRAALEIRSGTSTDVALRGLAAHTGVPAVLRFVESLIVAIDLGSPLAEVARAQASDIRADERRRLMESAGRKDVAMLVPIVFLVLPSVVLIALFPGVQSLHLVVP